MNLYRFALNLLTDLFFLSLPRNRNTEKVGLVRLDAIGDFIVWLPSAQSLVKHLRSQGREVVLVVNALWGAWAADLLGVAETVLVEPSRLRGQWRYRLSVMRQVRRLRLGAVVSPTYSRIPGDGNDTLVFASGAHERIGHRGYVSRSRLAGRLRALLNRGYSRIVDPEAQIAARAGLLTSELQVNARFVAALGAMAPQPLAFLPPETSSRVTQLLPQTPYVALIPGGSWSGKAWPVERFIDVARKLRSAGMAIVVCGSRDEAPLCEQLAGACDGVNLAGATSLADLVEVLRRARLVLGNDSAGIHIAVAVRTDSVCVMWGGSFGRFIPYEEAALPAGLTARAVYRRMDCFGCTGTCPFPSVEGKVPCIAAVQVQDVWHTVQQTLRTELPAAGDGN